MTAPQGDEPLHTMMLDQLSAMPRVWMALRWLVEDGFRGEKEAIARELRPWEGVGERQFLDFGCGSGGFARCFPPASYTGFDPAPHYVRHAGQHHPGRYTIMLGQELGFASERFDAALILGIIHHLPDSIAAGAIAELHRVVRPGGTVLVMEDTTPAWWNLPGHMMHMLDRGKFIRSDADYRALFAPHFEVLRAYPMRSGICDYAVYVLERR